MNSLYAFKMQAGMFAVFWFLYSLYGIWKTRKSCDERIAESKEKVDELISLTKLLPFPKILPGLFVVVWVFCIIIDVIGAALLFSVVNRIDWVVKILTIVLLLTAINGFQELIGNLQAMEDEQRLRERLLSIINLRAMRILDIEIWTRLLLSLILIVGIYL